MIFIQKYLSNTSWIMFEKIFNMGLMFIVTIFVARYLGPEKFGILSYAISLFAIAGHMGLSGLIVRERGKTIFLKSIGIIIGFFLIVCFILLTEDSSSEEFWILLIISLSILFQPIRVIGLLLIFKLSTHLYQILQGLLYLLYLKLVSSIFL